METCELADPNFTANNSDRCYHCKSELFGLLIRVAEAQGLEHVVDGSNLDDLSDHRPGRRAASELGVLSPLAAVGLTKPEIRELAQELGLPNWNKPSMACFASRFPYGERITDDGLARVSAAEQSLRDLGISQFRVRAHGPVARIEIAPEELQSAWDLRERIASAVRSAGFAYASLDLDGYRTGSMNEVLATAGRGPRSHLRPRGPVHGARLPRTTSSRRAARSAAGIRSASRSGRSICCAMSPVAKGRAASVMSMSG